VIDFLFRKMWKNKWMMLCLLIGNILLLGIVAATPLYTQATMERILQQNFRRYAHEANRHPAIMEMRLNLQQLVTGQMLPTYRSTANEHIPQILAQVDMPISQVMTTYTLSNWQVVADAAREPRQAPRGINLTGIFDMEEMVSLIYGRLPIETNDPNLIEAIATDALLLRHNMLVGEAMRVTNVDHPSGDLYVRIVGIYEFAQGSGQFWTAVRFNHVSAINNLLVHGDLVRARFLEPYPAPYRISAQWHHLLDYAALSATQVPNAINALATAGARFNFAGSAWTFVNNFEDTLNEYTMRTGPLAVTLLVLQVPIYIMLAFYIYMVSRQILQMEKNDISVLKSRGASRRQLMAIYALQGLFVAIVSLPLGVWLGVAICHVLGASSGFLYLVQRATLDVRVTPVVLLYAAGAMLLSFLTMFVPVIDFSRVGIVEHKQKQRGRNASKALWQRFYLDVLFLGAALYGLYTFNNQREAMAAMVRVTASVDPLLFLSASLFIIGAGLFALRLFPYFIMFVYLLGRRWWRPHTFAALLRVIRSSGEEQFIMIFLVFTLAIGIFSAHSARTINTNNDHRIQYLAGTDLVFREHWQNNIPDVRDVGLEVAAILTPRHVVYFEPSFDRFMGFDQVDAITRVQHHNVRRGTYDIQFMAIETHTFGETLWFRDDLLGVHINHFLNALAKVPNGALVSTNFRDVKGYALGDVITVQDSYAHSARLEIVGFVDYWPGYEPRAVLMSTTGDLLQEERFLAVANLGYMQNLWGVMPYQIWMRTNTPTNQFFYDFLGENDLHIVEFIDGRANVITSRSDPILQGTNGVLTINFIVTLLICFVGFLIYWVLSIRSRVLQFGVFRAMGMSMGRIMGLLVSEQVIITFTSIGIGTAVGIVAARVFVPLIQLSYSAAQQVIPLVVVIEGRDYRNLFVIVGVMVVLCLGVLVGFVAKIKIAQALKLGED